MSSTNYGASGAQEPSGNNNETLGAASTATTAAQATGDATASTNGSWRNAIPNVITNLLKPAPQNEPEPAGAEPTATVQSSNVSAPTNDGDVSMTDGTSTAASASTAAPVDQNGSQSLLQTAEPRAKATAPASTVPKKKLEKRTLPARLRRVSSKGASVGEALKDHHQRMTYDDHLLPGSTPLVLTNDLSVIQGAELQTEPMLKDSMRLFTDPEVAEACRVAEIIETPDFKARDDTLVVGGRTRGSLAEEDTSDEAYERRHRRPENAEKRVRKSEIDRLRSDRGKLADRLEQLKAAGNDVLKPIWLARKKQVSAPAAANDSESKAQAIDADLEKLREELVVDLQKLIARHDTLLAQPGPSFAVAGEKRRSGAAFTEGDADAAARTASKKARQSAIAASRSRATSSRGARGGRRGLTSMRQPLAASRNAAADAKDENLTRAQRVRRAMNFQQRRAAHSAANKTRVHIAGREAVGSLVNNQGKLEQVFKEEGKHNIHARTSGGRFAPKPKPDGSLPAARAAKKAAPKPAPRKSAPAAATVSRTSSGRRARASLPAAAATPTLTATPTRTESARSRRVSTGKTSASTSRRAASSAASSPEKSQEPDSPRTGVTQERFNIVGRTKGGRFASKAELGIAEEAARRRNRKSTGSIVSTRSTRSRGRRSDVEEVAANRTGPSLAQVAADSSTSRRVRLAETNDSDSGTPGPSAGGPKPPKPRKGPVLSATPAYKPAALSEEEAQRLLEAALAGEDDEDGDSVLTGPGGAGSLVGQSGVSSLGTTPAPEVKMEDASTASIQGGPGAAEGHAQPATIQATDDVKEDAITPSAPADAAAVQPESVDGPAAEPGRRESNRVKSSSAFGEKLPGVLNKADDFATVLEPMMESQKWQDQSTTANDPSAVPPAVSQNQGPEQPDPAAATTTDSQRA